MKLRCSLPAPLPPLIPHPEAADRPFPTSPPATAPPALLSGCISVPTPQMAAPHRLSPSVLSTQGCIQPVFQHPPLRSPGDWDAERGCTGTILGGCSAPPSPCEPTLGGLDPLGTRIPPEPPTPDTLPLKSALHCNPAFYSCLASGLRGRAKKGCCRLRIALFMEDILGRNNVPALGIVGTLYFCHSGSWKLRDQRGRLPVPRFAPS